MKKSETEAQERIEVTVCENGVVNVHRPESDRAHSVFVDDGEAIRCSCKGHKFHGHCTHQDEVERRPLVISSASATSHEVMTDGGEDEDEEEPSNAPVINTATGWGTSSYRPPEDEEIDDTPL